MSIPTIRESACPNPAALQRFLDDELPEADAAPVQEHIDACASCQEALARLLGAFPDPLDALAPAPRGSLSEQDTIPNASLGPPIEVPGYEVLGELGRGGMGVVYRARELRLDRIVAIKVLLSGRHSSPKDRARFVHEAEAVAQLTHPHIVTIYEAGQHGDLPYFALEFVSGGNLAGLLAGKPLPPMTAARLVEEIARGMHYAHERGIVHRDLKPGNILLKKEEAGRGTEAGDSYIPKITDFGLAKSMDSNAGLTSTGAIFGTPSYMAPEQAVGATREVGAAADVYALGAILYECLTGRPPFYAPTATETILQVLQTEPVPPSRLQPTVPRDLETICLKCLQKAVGKRYASAQQLAKDLRRFQAGEPIWARPVGRVETAIKWCRRHPSVAALSAALVLLLVAAGALVGWQWRAAVATLAELREEQKARARRQVAALGDASAASVPAILEELEAHRETVAPLLVQAYQTEKNQGRRMRLALALLPIDPETVRRPLMDWMLQVEDPAEVLLVRDALQRFSVELAGPLWDKALDAATSADTRFRALVALAAYDRDNLNWKQSGPKAVEYLLWSNPLHRTLWTEALGSVAQSLQEPLVEASYYPLKVGSKWHYKTASSERPKDDRVTEIVKIEKIDGQLLARLEATVGGTTVATEHLSSTAKGIFRHRHNGLDLSPPLCLLKFPIEFGALWESEMKLEDGSVGKIQARLEAEKIATPAGAFETVRVAFSVFNSANHLTYSTTYWFAPGIGPVKQLINTDSAYQDIGLAGVNAIVMIGLPADSGPLMAANYAAIIGINSLVLTVHKFEEGK